MGRLILFNMVSLDGFFEGPDHDISWHQVDDEFNRFAAKQLAEVGALVFGRLTYELMAAYWPTDLAKADDPSVAEKMNQLPKYVFSRTLSRADWEHTTLFHHQAADEIPRLKQQVPGDLLLLGSATLASDLLRHGLIDELRLMVNPVLLGQGRLLFSHQRQLLGLTLVSAQSFGNGNVLSVYRPASWRSTGPE